MTTAIQGKLPEGFPGLAALEAAGITTYAGVRNAGELTSIPGIGDATAKSIDEAMEAAQASHDQGSDTSTDAAANDTAPVSTGEVPANVLPPGGVFISPETRIKAALGNIEDQVRAVKSRTNDQGQADQEALAIVADCVEKVAADLHDRLSEENVFDSPVDFAFKVATPPPKRLEPLSEKKDVPAPGSAARFPYMGVVGEAAAHPE